VAKRRAIDQQPNQNQQQRKNSDSEVNYPNPEDQIVDEINVENQDEEIDNLLIINEQDDLNLSSSGGKSRSQGSNVGVGESSSPSFTRPTESYQNRRALEHADRERRDSAGSATSSRPAFCSTANRNSGAHNNVHTSDDRLRQIKNAYTQQNTSGGRGRQVAWESSSTNETHRSTPQPEEKENEKKENIGEVYDEKTRPQIFDKLSNPQYFTGTQKQKILSLDQEKINSTDGKKVVTRRAMMEERLRRKKTNKS